MCDCVPSTLLAYSGIRIRKLGFTGCNWGPRNEPIREVDTINSSNVCNSEVTRVKDGGLRHIRGSFKPTGCEIKRLKSMNCLRVSRNPGMLGSDECEFYGELGFKEKGEKHLEFETSQNDAALENSTMEIKEDCESSDAWASSSSDFVELKDVLESEKRSTTSKGSLKDEDLVRIEGSDGVGSKLDEPVQFNGRPGLRNGRQVMRRSNMLAKQVISMESALTLGFVSQLWVNTYSWVVLVVEVRPNLLSGELERFLLEDVSQVGDVVLIQDERVMENEFKMVGLETLVGYKVVTPGRRNIGKVRGYTFNINSGAVESLELDSFGISIIPSSLVSTYALCVEDVLEVVSDTVVVHEAAASRIQKLTKGFWDTGNVKTSIDEFGEYSDLARQPVRSDSRSSGQKFRPKMRKTEDDWELPMDYL